MEEDIELLENYCKSLQGKHLDNRVRAIQNLLQAYKEDEGVIDKMAGYIDLAADEYISKMLNKGDVAYYGSRYCIKRYFRNKVKGEKE